MRAATTMMTTVAASPTNAPATYVSARAELIHRWHQGATLGVRICHIDNMFFLFDILFFDILFLDLFYFALLFFDVVHIISCFEIRSEL